MNRSQVLNQLQNLDTKLGAKRKLLLELQTRRTDDSRLALARGELERALAIDSELRARLRDAEMRAMTLTDKFKTVNSKLYGGQISNPKELAGLELDAQMLKRQRDELDDQMLGLMSEIEATETDARTKQTQFDTLETDRKRDVVTIEHEIAELEALIAKVEHEREAIRSKASSEDLGIYEAIAYAHGGRAVAVIKGMACSACGIDLPSALRSRAQMGEDLTLCPNCGRILAA